MTPTEQIQVELGRIERDQNVCILYACESGSRAWGFESQDSDFDVRFIYVQPTQWYLRVMLGRDVIEPPADEVLDISGWDLRKALQLLRSSNPPLLEWLQSPIVYRERQDITAWIRELMPQYYQPATCHYHYLHMAQGNNREYLQGDVVWLKKYLYVLRPVLACLWIERDYGVVPMKFDALIDRILDDGELKTAVQDMVRRKKDGDELARGPRIPIISDFLERELARLSEKPAPPATRTSTDDLDRVFRRCLIEVYGGRIEPGPPSCASDP
ncbi:MAG: nucleotidyltransferase domain-containing protein [Planctomycetaceae bacterium]|nr:MAG: nucleotidyltransferase domain-containing protein [Planctomycetaceae bacterium]